MENNFIEVDNCRIHYLQKNKQEEKTLVFIHGNSGSSRTWEKQLNDLQFSRYRLIAFDLPGHGDSSPNSDYSPLVTAKILAKAIEQLVYDAPYILIGFSYGTNLIAEMINDGLHPKGMVMVGMCCIGEQYGMDKVFIQTEQPSVFFYNENERKVVHDFIKQSVLATGDADCLTEEYFNTDNNFRPLLMEAAAEGKLTDEMLALEKVTMPVCVIFGEQDNLVQTYYLDNSVIPLWKGRVYKLGSAGHFVHIDKPDTVNALIAEYAHEMFTPVHA